MNEVCALCCAMVTKRPPIQCRKCAKLLQCYYCSTKCKKADAKRHEDECEAALSMHGRELLESWRRPAPTDADAVYRCGTRDHTGCGALGFEVRRQLPSSSGDVPGTPRPPSVANQAKAQKRPAADGSLPMMDWKRRFVEGSNACCKPWVSFADSTSVLVSWLPPTASNRFAHHTYRLEYREHVAPIQEGERTPGPWQALSETHNGTTPSHWAKGLTTGSWVQFQVKATGPEEWLTKGEFSEPSDPFHVGFADFTPCPQPGKVLPTTGFTEAEIDFFMTLDTPAKVQDYLDTIPMNHEVQNETFLSACETVRQNHGHCVEGAMVGAYILSLHGHPPYIMDMIAHDDDSHNVVPFNVKGRWGCLSVSNHSSLRYRNPVYRSIRELMMSYIDDYMNGQGERSLVGFTKPMNLRVVFGRNWASRRGETWEIGYFTDLMYPYDLISLEKLAQMRSADSMMQSSTVLQREWRCPDNFDEEAARRNENK